MAGPTPAAPARGPVLEPLEARLLLSCAFDLDGDDAVGPGDEVIFEPAWRTEGGYPFGDVAQPPDALGWDYLCDFDGDFAVNGSDYAWLSSNWGLPAGDPSIVFPSDPHDSDESAALADAQGAYPEETWFFQTYGHMAIANDGEDYFRIDVPAGSPRVIVECRFEHAWGNIDLELLDSLGARIAIDEGTSDNASLDAIVPAAGAYYVRVFSPDGASGQRYDLWWQAAPPPDYHEDDENEAQAATHGNFPEDTWYSDIYGVPGVQADFDTFMIDVPTDQFLLTVDCTFSHAEGNIDLYLIDDWAQIIAGSWSTDDNEHLEFLLDYDGTHYLQVIGPDAGQTYDLQWHAEAAPLVAVLDTATIAEDSTGNLVDVLANDVGTGLVITHVSSGWTDGSFAYIDAYPDYNGVTYMDYEIEEVGGVRDWGFIEVTITPVPDDPVAEDDTAELPEDSIDYVIDVLANDSDADNDTLTIQSVVVTSGVPIGSAWTDGDYVYYTPNPGEHGAETLQYVVNDGTGRTDSADVDVWVFSGEDPPVAVGDYAEVIESHPRNLINVTANDYDPDGDAFTIIDFPTLPSHGAVSLDGTLVDYVPTEGYRGPDAFEYTIEDTTGRQATATVDIFVLPPSDFHEEDDNLAEAAAQGVAPHMNAPRYLLDEDYYMIEIVAGSDDQFTAELWCGTDVDMQLLDSGGALVATSFTVMGDKFIDTTAISPGTYYVRVFVTTGDYWGQAYVMQWDSFGPADPHEPDNTYGEADALGPLPPDTRVAGVSNDVDWYRIDVTAGHEYVDIQCSHLPIATIINLEVWDEYGTMVAGSYRYFGRGEDIQVMLAPGPYYIRVFGGGYLGYEYELWWRDLGSDDPHEDDDSIGQANAQGLYWGDTSFYETYGQWAVQQDDDYYRIDARPGYLNLQVDCLFSDGDGDIDIFLLDADGAELATGVSTTSNEHIDCIVPDPGPYYVKVNTYGVPTGLQTYDLIWHDNWSDDLHEPDSSVSQADDLGPLAEETWFDGTSWNGDTFLIDVPVGQLDVEIDLQFLDAEGDLALVLLKPGRTPIASSDTSTNDEYISTTVPEPGEYYIRVESGDSYAGQSYDLWWNAVLTEDDHEVDDSTAEADVKGNFDQNDPFNGFQHDDDIYRIDVPFGYEHVYVDCLYDPDEGDVDILLADEWGTPIAGGMGSGLGDGDHIDVTVPADGVYYIYVYDGEGGSGRGQQYRLDWSAVQADDTHENDNTPALADLKGDFAEETWFTGRMWNQDVYRIDVPFGSQRVTADCLFSHAEGNITLVLRDPAGNVLDISNGLSDDEHVDAIAHDPGPYYLYVSAGGGGAGQSYDLRWDGLADDDHEQDDTTAQADARGELIRGDTVTGIQQDEDLYRINVVSGHETVEVRCEYEYDEGDIDLYLLDGTGQCVAYSTGDGDSEYFRFSVASAGTYYIEVRTYGGATGQVYDLWWDHLPGPEYEWNIMVYLDADNNLEYYAQPDIDEMTAAGLPTDVAVTLLVDGWEGEHLGYTTTKRGRLGGAMTDLGELNMGEPQTLVDFVGWSMEHYPAYRTCLVLWDHGGGFGGCCSDDTDGDGLDMIDLRSAFGELPHLDIIGFDCCQMAMVEVTYQLRDFCDYVVASEANIPGTGWDYDRWLDDLAADVTMDPRTLAEEAVIAYGQTYPGGGCTLSAVSTSPVRAVAEDMDEFAHAVLDDADLDDWAAIQNAKLQATSFGDFRDLGEFLYLVETAPGVTSSIATAAYAARRNLQVMVKENFDGAKVTTTGQTAFLPMNTIMTQSYETDDLDFLADTYWREFLRGLRAVDDTHEDDTTRDQAISEGQFPSETWFTGTQLNDDYFYFTAVYMSENRVTVDCQFSHAEGDIDLYLLDYEGDVLAASESHTDDELIVFDLVQPGGYFLLVTSPNGVTGQSYDLRYTRTAPPGEPEGAASGRPGKGLDGNGSPKIDVELVVLPAASGSDTSATLPGGVSEVYEYAPFVVEVWMSNLDGSPNGITGGYVAMSYDDWAAVAEDVHTGGIYTGFPDGDMLMGAIESMGGQAPLGQIDYGDDEWVRLGYVEFSAEGEGWLMISPWPGFGHLARAYEGAVAWADVQMDDFVTVEIVPLPATIDVDLQPGSDSGASDSDNITNDNTPTYDVTVNFDGMIYIDYDGDAAWDDTLFVMEAGTYPFTPAGPLGDGEYPVNVRFEAFELEPATDSDPTTIDTQAPQVTVTPRVTSNASPYLSGEVDDPAAAVEVTVDGTPYAAVNAGGGTWSIAQGIIGPLDLDTYDVAATATDLAGNPGTDATVDELVICAEVVDRRIFYNNSAWDGHDPLPNAADDNAVAPNSVEAMDPALGKEALLPGDTATFVNYTSYSRGINGIMVDIQGMPGTPTGADFVFETGNSSGGAWNPAPAPASVTVRPIGGGIDRVTIIWNDNDIEKMWLKVIVLPTAQTGLHAADVFYWGNAIGETGNDPANAYVNSADRLATRANPHNFFDPAGIEDAYDFNRDKNVNSADRLKARANTTNFFTALKLITPPPGAPTAGGGPAAETASASPDVATAARRPATDPLAAAAIEAAADDGLAPAVRGDATVAPHAGRVAGVGRARLAGFVRPSRTPDLVTGRAAWADPDAPVRPAAELADALSLARLIPLALQRGR